MGQGMVMIGFNGYACRGINIRIEAFNKHMLVVKGGGRQTKGQILGKLRIKLLHMVFSHKEVDRISMANLSPTMVLLRRPQVRRVLLLLIYAYDII